MKTNFKVQQAFLKRLFPSLFMPNLYMNGSASFNTELLDGVRKQVVGIATRFNLHRCLL
jgi:hypothetical protein